jgi:hypothetical protein
MRLLLRSDRYRTVPVVVSGSRSPDPNPSVDLGLDPAAEALHGVKSLLLLLLFAALIHREAFHRLAAFLPCLLSAVCSRSSGLGAEPLHIFPCGYSGRNDYFTSLRLSYYL